MNYAVNMTTNECNNDRNIDVKLRELSQLNQVFPFYSGESSVNTIADMLYKSNKIKNLGPPCGVDCLLHSEH